MGPPAFDLRSPGLQDCPDHAQHNGEPSLGLDVLDSGPYDELDEQGGERRCGGSDALRLGMRLVMNLECSTSL